jgi:hypothetical protein
MISLESSTLVRLCAIAVVGSLAACGGAGEARSPAKASEPDGTSPASPERGRYKEATSVEDAQQQIAAAKAELANVSSRTESAPAKSGTFARPPGGGDADRPADTSPPAPPMQSRKPSSPESSVTDSSRNTGDERCTSPCRALASMRRAVNALCRMTGTDDTRCADAKRTLVESEGRVSPCSC